MAVMLLFFAFASKLRRYRHDVPRKSVSPPPPLTLGQGITPKVHSLSQVASLACLSMFPLPPPLRLQRAANWSRCWIAFLHRINRCVASCSPVTPHSFAPFGIITTHAVVPLFCHLSFVLQEISASLNPSFLIPGAQAAVPVEQPKKQYAAFSRAFCWHSRHRTLYCCQNTALDLILLQVHSNV